MCMMCHQMVGLIVNCYILYVSMMSIGPWMNACTYICIGWWHMHIIYRYMCYTILLQYFDTYFLISVSSAMHSSGCPHLLTWPDHRITLMHHKLSDSFLDDVCDGIIKFWRDGLMHLLQHFTAFHTNQSRRYEDTTSAWCRPAINGLLHDKNSELLDNTHLKNATQFLQHPGIDYVYIWFFAPMILY